MSSLHCTLPQKLCLLQSFGAILPNNVDLTAKYELYNYDYFAHNDCNNNNYECDYFRIVKCAVQQETPRTEIAQSLLATHLAKFPNNVPLWRMYVVYHVVKVTSIKSYSPFRVILFLLHGRVALRHALVRDCRDIKHIIIGCTDILPSGSQNTQSRVISIT